MSVLQPTPFRRILIANRGEVARRIQRSARALGYETAAVYSSADARSPHVKHADVAVCIGEPEPARSYLNIPALLDAARRAGADAVHPGYGFLAENAEFAQACRDASLVFIGPSPQAIAAMGDKAAARRALQQVGVPCIPGFDAEHCTDERLAAAADALGYPLVIKARAGGGGRGMRVVRAREDFAAALRSARAEAQHAFGSDAVLLEREIAEARHIEIQILADRHGVIVHFGERDCSVQRRHQKLIEEAPSPAVDESLRERMGAVAVAAARSIRYEGAGTIEFLLDRDGAFHFLEMNTRLQVEHAVTEAVYGVDLVAWQLRIAAGEPLDLQQSALRPRGHAIEARLCAEDPRHEFVPQAGTMLQWAPPSGLRVEHALEPGASVPPFYDPMIAKLIAWGADRDEARRRLERGLETTVALGVVTNRDFLRRCVSHPAFAAGQATTGFVATHLPALTAPDPPAHRKLLALAALLLRSEPSAADARSTAGAAASALRPRLALRAVLRHDGCDRTVAIAAVDADPNRCLRVTVEGVEHRMRLVELDPTWVRFACDGLVQQAGWARDGARIWLSCDGTTCEIEDRTLAPAAPQQRTGAGDGMLRAAMTGRVVAVFAAPGDRIEAGQPLVSLEAMKMEHLQCAPVAGTLKSLHATPGAQIAAGTLLAQIDPVRLDR